MEEVKSCIELGVLRWTDVFIWGILIGAVAVFVGQWTTKALDLFIGNNQKKMDLMLGEALKKMQADLEVKK